MDVALDKIDWHGPRGLRYRATVNRAGVLVFKPRLRSLRDLVVWASGKSNYFISKFLNQTFNAASFSFPGTLYAALWTSTLNAASTGSTSGEASYTGYARVAITANTTNFPTSSTGSAIQNGTAITFPANAGSLQTMTFFAILDASSAGNVLYWGSITSTAINPGDTPQVNINGLTVTEA
jgi:hypothetical protein